MTSSAALFFLAATASLGVAVAVTPFIRDHADRLGLVDQLHERKVHTTPVPRVGGLAVFAAVVAAAVICSIVVGIPNLLADAQLGAAIAGAVGMVAVGLLDDIRPLEARTKLAAQVALAIATVLLGLRPTAVAIPLLGVIPLSPIASGVLTVVWLVAFTNAFNLIDGLDGLAGSIALFAFASLFTVAVLGGRIDAAFVAALLAGAVFGFLRSNFPRASIFLGDSGSLSIGFCLAALGLIATRRPDGVVPFAVPVVILAIPLIDTTVAIIRRFVSGVPIFSPDRGHIHHRVLSFGYSPRAVTLLFSGIAAVLAVSGVFVARFASYALPVLICAGLLAIGIIYRLRFFEFQEFGVSVRRGLVPRAAIGRNVRFRQVSVQITKLHDVGGVLSALEDAFHGGVIPRAELRMQRRYLTLLLASQGASGRADDELCLWNWVGDHGASTTAWQIALPLLASDGGRIGSLVIWDTPPRNRANLHYLEVIATYLRAELARKLELLLRDAALQAATGDEVFTGGSRPSERRWEDEPAQPARRRPTIETTVR